MVGPTFPTAIDPAGARRHRPSRPAGTGRSVAPAASDRFAPTPYARPPGARQHPRPDAEIVGGEVSLRSLPLASFHSITSSARASTVAGTSRPSALAVLR